MGIFDTIGDWVKGGFETATGHNNYQATPYTGVNPNAYQYGGAPGGADEAANRYQQQGAAAQNRMASQADYGNANQYQAGGVQDRAQQQNALQLQQQAAMGNAPSRAELLGRQQSDAAASAQNSLAASARGPAAMALAQQNAAANTAGAQANIANSAMAQRADEMAQARNAYGAAASALRGSDLASQQQAAQQSQYNAGLQAQQRAQNDQYQLGMTQAEQNVRAQQLGAQENQQALNSANYNAVQGINAGVAQSNAEAGQRGASGVMKGISGLGVIPGLSDENEKEPVYSDERALYKALGESSRGLGNGGPSSDQPSPEYRTPDIMTGASANLPPPEASKPQTQEQYFAAEYARTHGLPAPPTDENLDGHRAQTVAEYQGAEKMRALRRDQEKPKEKKADINANLMKVLAQMKTAGEDIDPDRYRRSPIMFATPNTTPQMVQPQLASLTASSEELKMAEPDGALGSMPVMTTDPKSAGLGGMQDMTDGPQSVADYDKSRAGKVGSGGTGGAGGVFSLADMSNNGLGDSVGAGINAFTSLLSDERTKTRYVASPEEAKNAVTDTIPLGDYSDTGFEPRMNAEGHAYLDQVAAPPSARPQEFVLSRAGSGGGDAAAPARVPPEAAKLASRKTTLKDAEEWANRELAKTRADQAALPNQQPVVQTASGKRFTAPSPNDMEQYLASTRGGLYSYKDPNMPGASEGVNYGPPSAQDMNKTGVGRTMTGIDPRTGRLAIDQDKALKAQMAATSYINDKVNASNAAMAALARALRGTR
jgi:hypothetical protein